MFDKIDVGGGSREQAARKDCNEFGKLVQHSILAFSQCFPTPESRQAQTLERGVSRSPTDVRHNDQFKNRDIGEFNSIFFDLAYCVRGTKIPLLAHDFSKRAPAIGRPSQDELLGTLCRSFFENERDASEPLRVIEE